MVNLWCVLEETGIAPGDNLVVCAYEKQLVQLLHFKRDVGMAKTM